MNDSCRLRLNPGTTMTPTTVGVIVFTQRANETGLLVIGTLRSLPQHLQVNKRMPANAFSNKLLDSPAMPVYRLLSQHQSSAFFYDKKTMSFKQNRPLQVTRVSDNAQMYKCADIDIHKAAFDTSLGCIVTHEDIILDDRLDQTLWHAIIEIDT